MIGQDERRIWASGSRASELRRDLIEEVTPAIQHFLTELMVVTTGTDEEWNYEQRHTQKEIVLEAVGEAIEDARRQKA